MSHNDTTTNNENNKKNKYNKNTNNINNNNLTYVDSTVKKLDYNTSEGIFVDEEFSNSNSNKNTTSNNKVFKNYNNFDNFLCQHQ